MSVTPSAGPDAARSAVLVTAETLGAWLVAGTQMIILAVRSDDGAAPRPFRTHPRIPGAIDASLAEDFSDPADPIRGTRPLPALAALQERMRRWGVDSDTLVVVYDHDGNLQAARAWWVLRWAGLARVLILDGGYPAWMRAGLPVASAAPELSGPSGIELRGGMMPELDAAASAAMAREGVLLDSRMRENYLGGDTEPGAPRRGHIPGAVSVPASANLDAEGCFKPMVDLRALYGRAGALGPRSVGVYCGAGVSAAHDVAALATLGVVAPMYAGSWSAWIGDPANPVATGAEPG